jgi:hypothetical protein
MWKHDEEFNQIQRRKVRIYKNGDFEAGKGQEKYLLLPLKVTLHRFTD